MDLKQLFQATIDALDKREADLVAQQTDVDNQKAALRTFKEALDGDKAQLTNDQNAVRDVEDVKAQRAANVALKLELEQKAVDLSNKENDLKKYESSLYEIKTHQDAREEALTAAGQVQAEREKTYKEKITNDFYAELKNRLPQ